MSDSLPEPASAEPAPAQRPFSIRFLPMNETIEVDPSEFPFGRDGLPGSILDIALGHDVDVDHACGGVCACSTCHVIVREGIESCCESTEEEEDQLDNAPGLEEQSRLACRCVPDGTQDLVVEIPEWNRNLVRETHD